MSVGFKVHFYWYQVGSADFLHSFFSTIAYNLEKSNWGKRFPIIMNKLYEGELKNDELVLAIEELKIIKKELKKCSVDKVIWDIDDLNKQPPWGGNISPDITDLSNYFVTSDGEDLITILQHALEKAIKLKTDLIISNM